MITYHCDKCFKEITDVFEVQEMYTISLHGGYASVFGDGRRIRIDLCQQCLYSMLKDAKLLENLNDSTEHYL